ncbi:MAG: lipid II flippase MurJ [Parachlamydiaceae bacterium]
MRRWIEKNVASLDTHLRQYHSKHRSDFWLANFILWIGFAIALMHAPLDRAMIILSVGISLACMGQWLVTLPQVYRLLKGKNIRINLSSPEVKRLWRPLFLTNLGIISTQINSGLDPLFARYANLEGPAWLWYAIRIEQVPLALFGIAMSGALLPPLARSAKEGNLAKFYSFLFTALKRSAFLMIPITIAIFLFGSFGVNLAFGYGDFGMKSLEGTVKCLYGYSIGLLPQTWVLILAPAFFARGDYKTPAIASVGAVIANTLFNTIAIFGFGWGAESVAYAASLAAGVNCAILWVRLKESLPYTLKETGAESPI